MTKPNPRLPVAGTPGDVPAIDALAINTIRTLSMDAVQAANSGHPGTPMALAPVAYALWQHVLRFDPADPIWPNRDRFVLSNGHASMLLYSLLHLSGAKALKARVAGLQIVASRASGAKADRYLKGGETLSWADGARSLVDASDRFVQEVGRGWVGSCGEEGVPQGDQGDGL